MGPEVVSILVLVVMFVIATLLPVNLGAIGFVAAAGVGVLVAGLSLDDSLAGFPTDLFLILVGLMFLFGIAQQNGTIDLLVQWSMRLVRGHLAAAPWIFFTLAAVFSAIGALFAVAIVAPLAMPFARRYRIDLMLMGMMVVHGSLAGAFSPISVYGVVVNGLVAGTALPSSPLTLFLVPLAFNLAIAAVVFLLFGGRDLLGVRSHHVDEEDEGPDDGAEPAGSAGPGPGVAVRERTTTGTRVSYPQVLTLAAVVALAVGTVGFGLDVGVLAMSLAVGIGILSPAGNAEALRSVSWSTVLLVCGVITYVGVLQEVGTTDLVGRGIVALGVPLVVALLLLYLGGVLSAFASSAGIIGVAIPLALPFLLQGSVSPIGMIAALAVATTVVDVSPFSTNGALVLASTPEDVDKEAFYRRMLAYAGTVVVVGPLLAWTVLILPGWL